MNESAIIALIAAGHQGVSGLARVLETVKSVSGHHALWAIEFRTSPVRRGGKRFVPALGQHDHLERRCTIAQMNKGKLNADLLAFLKQA